MHTNNIRFLNLLGVLMVTIVAFAITDYIKSVVSFNTSIIMYTFLLILGVFILFITDNNSHYENPTHLDKDHH